MKAVKRYILIVLILLMVLPSQSDAQPAPGCAQVLSAVNVRDSYQALGAGLYTQSRDYIKACIREGYDPPHGGEYSWMPRRGRGHGSLSGANVQLPVGRASAQCPTSVMPENETCEHQEWPNCNGSPGGLGQENGPGTDTCIVEANATGAATTAAEGEPELTIPEPPEFECGLNFSASFSGGIGQGQACASGGASFCGIISVGGSACVGADGVELGAEYVGPGGRFEGEVGYNEIQGLPLDSALQLANYLQTNPNSNFILPGGGTIDFGGEIFAFVERDDGTSESIPLSSLSLPTDAFISANLQAGITDGFSNNGTVIVTPDATYRIPFAGVADGSDPRNFEITSGNGDLVFTNTNATDLPNLIPQHAQAWLNNITSGQAAAAENSTTTPPPTTEQ